MTDWKALSHAYGEASAIPRLIDRLRERPDEKTWDDLWSCLCHQGTVYSASYAALQPLCELARASPPSERLSPLILIANIIVSDDLRGVDRRPTDLIQPLIPELQTLADECMCVGGLETVDFLYCLARKNSASRRARSRRSEITLPGSDVSALTNCSSWRSACCLRSSACTSG